MQVVHSGNINTFTQPVLDALALEAPINNPTFTGTLSCPQSNPQISQTNFKTIKTPGLYHYDGGLSNAPSSSLSIEIGRADRYSRIAMPWDAN